MATCNDKKIFWIMGIVAFCLIVTVITLVVSTNYSALSSWKFLLPISVMLACSLISVALIMVALKCGGKKELTEDG
ncbi:MAG: hypothetical protein HOK75_05435 [Phycisphaerae bacterium]|nr:hypothetical protein [Phycisphaerae bacterium]MBT5409688.1 hypothetical protein [Phycisphaerae bacterium]MBT6165804.1 hypothetical protein [Phycisphaerae bacterium]MBT7657663.1 hypothetical protein [Phycisphaerae bacterium]